MTFETLILRVALGAIEIGFLFKNDWTSKARPQTEWTICDRAEVLHL